MILKIREKCNACGFTYKPNPFDIEIYKLVFIHHFCKELPAIIRSKK